MITLELAKQLKESGFPQEAEEGDGVYYCYCEKEYDYKWIPLIEEEKRMIKIGGDMVMNAFNGSACIIEGGSPEITFIDGVECKKVYKNTFKRIGERWDKTVLSLDEDGWEWWLGDEDDYIKIPSLQELIEACGDRFSNLEQMTFEDKEVVYDWVKEEGTWHAEYQKGITVQECASGFTPEEAVAKLWLKLNE